MTTKGYHHTPETKEKIRLAKKGHVQKFVPSFAGHFHSPEERARMSAGMRGKKRSAEGRANMSAAKKGNKNSLGRHHSEETKHKLSLLAKKRIGRLHPNWKGGKRKDIDGYILIYMPNHPHCHKGKCVFEHRFIMESHLGRFLLPTEIVHHINNIKDDNRIENLCLFSSNKEHKNLHRKIFKK